MRDMDPDVGKCTQLVPLSRLCVKTETHFLCVNMVDCGSDDGVSHKIPYFLLVMEPPFFQGAAPRSREEVQ